MTERTRYDQTYLLRCAPQKAEQQPAQSLYIVLFLNMAASYYGPERVIIMCTVSLPLLGDLNLWTWSLEAVL